ncbi:MAG: dihydroneopterin triphosphate diphosphatase [Gammaproteobacteria bacterium]|nr:dihydroneopterin triphosphate diphosphatase [Gammaproteobacteria bacterium]MDH3370236.1 dihydroneopterin triphosphate diphosphatase [Gammaproteobacteria bacterium]MDH3406002.1 dihydroneopterin triphosphate diphosphatase [Gammaproteobacteria bacterium]MDH3561913.1 dihydroneopterin triphosphate diphosphatase [Gammaproteobacteria bacterium]MDH5486377.1 dihydroneopterin triphosphate diphosphatase [Gammaproteobacteria bacterium]
MSPPTKKFKRPESVLVVVYTGTGKVLLLRRADDPGFWQSVTGSLRWEETEPRRAAARELEEETGLVSSALQATGRVNRYTILPQWRHRYSPEVNENSEHVFYLALPDVCEIVLNSSEHTEYGWYSFDAAAEKAASWSNREAILKLKENVEAGHDV